MIQRLIWLSLAVFCIATVFAEVTVVQRTEFYTGVQKVYDTGGKELASFHILMKRRLFSRSNFIIQTKKSLGDDGELEQSTKFYQVGGNNSFDIHDYQKKIRGHGTFSGKGLNWDTWKSRVFFPDGSYSSSKERIRGDVLIIKRTFYSSDSDPIQSEIHKLRRVGEGEYSILLEKLGR